jgi:membrane protein involved in colicin uptake
MKSEELTRKAIEAICGNIASKRSAQVCKRCGKEHWPSQVCVGTGRKAESEEESKSWAEALEEAEERWRAESKARAEAQEKAKTEADKRARIEAEARDKARAFAEQIAQMQARAEAEREARTAAEEKAKAKSEARARAEAAAKAGAAARAKAEEKARTEANFMDIPIAQGGTASCDCCGKGDVQAEELVRIDSGQVLCPDCLKELRGSCTS